MKDGKTGGFRDAAGENVTLTATWQAVQLLAAGDAKGVKGAREALADVHNFILLCQGSDGGFSRIPHETEESMFRTHSTAAATAQALHILNLLQARGLASSSLIDPVAYANYNGISYLRSCLSLKNGVMASYPSDAPD